MDESAPPPETDEGQVTPQQALELATTLLQKGHVEPAAEICRRVLAVLPDHADAHHYLAVAIYHQGQTEPAIDHLRRAIAIEPEYAEAHNNLGNVFRQQGRFEEAAAAYERALALRPDSADALNNVGTILRARGKLDQAMEMYRRALERAPDHADAHHNLGNALIAVDRGDEALEEFKKALLLRPYHRSSYFQLGYAFSATGRLADAADVFRKWLAIDPDNPEARHLLAACTGDVVPARASNDFVRQTFDAFAFSFDEVLGRLEYKAPTLVAEAVGRFARPEGALDVLDAGCGTGLGGTLLRPFAGRLTGVDLSERMLGFARSRGAYDDLAQAELTEYLEAHPQGFDLITSIDTLCYFGDLGAAMLGFAKAMRPKGYAVFTLEKANADDAPLGYRLNPHGRYSHSETYLRAVLSQVRLEVHSLTEGVLRYEMQKPVAGFVVVAGKPPQSNE